MNRVKLKIPEPVLYRFGYKIRINDLNYGNHLANDKVLQIAHEARAAFVKSLGYNELDIEGTGMIMADAMIQYLAEGKEDDLLTVEIAIDQLRNMAFDVYHHLILKDNGKSIAKVKAAIVGFDYQNKKVAPFPHCFLSKLKQMM